MDNEDVVAYHESQCGICRAPADRISNRFQCSKNAGHMADFNTGIFTDLNPYPEIEEENEPAKDVLC